MVLALINYVLEYYIFTEFFCKDTPSALWKYIRKALGKEPLSINIPDYKYDNKYPEFEKQLKAVE